VFRAIWSGWQAKKRSDERATKRDKLRQIHSFVTQVMEKASQQETGDAMQRLDDQCDESNKNESDRAVGSKGASGSDGHGGWSRGGVFGAGDVARNDKVRSKVCDHGIIEQQAGQHTAS
jgi:hypothetical protein